MVELLDQNSLDLMAMKG